MARAARLTARAEAAARDPCVSVNDLVRIDGAASRARQAMLALLAAKPTIAVLPLRERLAAEAADAQ